MENPLKLKRIHHVEFYVGNAKQSAYFYRHAMGFSQAAYSGLETGNRRFASYLLRQGKADLLLTTPLDSSSAASEHVRRHGDGVRDIALEVADADAAFAEAMLRGAQGVEEPHWLEDEHGRVRRAAIQSYGDTIHSLISRNGYKGAFLPGYADATAPGNEAGILRIDHIVGNVELGRMRHWAEYYERVFGFHRFITFDDKDISTEFSALMSMVMSDDSYSVKFPINEPAPGKRRSQIDEYLDAYCGPGVQHIALQSRDVITTVRKLRAQGIEFLRVPDTYYRALPARAGDIGVDLEAIAELGILVDRDEDGYLLQIFTRPVEDRPTVFYEIIERQGSRGFGKGNFKALFEAIEAEQARRGNL